MTSSPHRGEEPPVRFIRSSAPLRINDIGGWTDTWFAGEGKVLNLAISLRVEAHLHVYENREKTRDRVSVHAEDFGESFLFNPERPSLDVHPLLQAAVSLLSVPQENRLEIRVFSQAPAGSSLGTSAAVCVALLGAMARVTSRQFSLDEIVSFAHRVETEKLGRQSGIQDQICAVYGGICFIHMRRYPEAKVERIKLEISLRKKLEERLCLFYLGKAHSSSTLHEEVIALLEKGGAQFTQIRRLKDLAEEARAALLSGDLEDYGRVMAENNECQRALHPALISRDADAVIEVARRCQASGWKVNGAGGEGGSLTILGSRDKNLRKRMIQEINSLGKGIRFLPFALFPEGLTVSEGE